MRTMVRGLTRFFPNLVWRLAENIMKSADNKIAEYRKEFEEMEKEFERNIFEGTYVAATFILDQVKDLRKSSSLSYRL